MTTKEFNIKSNEILSDISEKYDEIRKLEISYKELKQQYLDEYDKIPYGTKIKLTGTQMIYGEEFDFQGIYYIGEYVYNSFPSYNINLNDIIVPELHEVKKDGTMSRKKALVPGLFNVRFEIIE